MTITSHEVLKVPVDDERDADVLKAGFIPGWIGEGGLLPEPKQDFAGHCWRWNTGRRLLEAAAGYIDPTKSERRNIRMANPVEGKRTSLNTIHCSYQMVAPKEFARAHRHTINAGRFILECTDAFTTLNGEKVYLKKNDIVLTPNWVWHGLGNESETDPAFWVDFLDDPLVKNMQTVFFEVQKDIEANPAVQPNSPLHIKWTDVQTLLNSAKPDPETYHGSRIALQNNAIPTANLYMDRMPPRFSTRTSKSTANRMFICAEGSGSTNIEGQTFTWERGDVIAVPSWKTFNHQTSDGATLFEFTDEPVMQAMNWYREVRQ